MAEVPADFSVGLQENVGSDFGNPPLGAETEVRQGSDYVGRMA